MWFAYLSNLKFSAYSKILHLAKIARFVTDSRSSVEFGFYGHIWGSIWIPAFFGISNILKFGSTSPVNNVEYSLVLEAQYRVLPSFVSLDVLVYVDSLF